METLPKDLLIELALELPGKDLITLCQTSQRYNFICNSQTFWGKKLWKDFNVNEEINPKHKYKVLKNKEICNQKVLEGKRGYVLNEISEDNFDNRDDYLVYLFLIAKILEKGKGLSDYYKGLYDRYIEKINYKYGNKILRYTEFPSAEEYQIFLDLLERAKVTPFQKAYIDGILYRGMAPNVTWDELCELPLY